MFFHQLYHSGSEKEKGGRQACLSTEEHGLITNLMLSIQHSVVIILQIE